MKILMITDFYWPFVGGVEQHVRSLSAELAGRGHQVSVVTSWQEGLAHLEDDGAVRVHRIQSSLQTLTWLYRYPGRPWAAPMPDPAASSALAKIVRSERPQVVHGHDWLARSFLPLKTRSGAKFVMSLHYYTLSCPKKNLMQYGTPCSGPQIMRCLHCASTHYGVGKGVP